MGIRVLIVDDHQMIREGLQVLVDREKDMEVVGVAEDGRTAIEKVGELLPDVVVMDVGMPMLNGIEATRQIVAQYPNARIIALSVHTERQFVTGMLSAGALGYLLKMNAFDELVDAIHSVLGNHVYLTPAITGVVVEDYVRHLSNGVQDKGPVLTAREQEVLQLLTEGNSNKEVAAKLDVSVKTVDTHRRHIMEKLGIRTLPELTKYAIRVGLTTLEE